MKTMERRALCGTGKQIKRCREWNQVVGVGSRFGVSGCSKRATSRPTTGGVWSVSGEGGGRREEGGEVGGREERGGRGGVWISRKSWFSRAVHKGSFS